MELPAVIVLLLAVARPITALQVTPGSRCAVECLDSPGGNEFSASDSTTTPDDVSCRDLDYSTTDAGIKFRKCLDCLQHSNKVEKTESDLRWYIYNLRYTLTTCMYGAPKTAKNGTVATQCNTDKACKAMKEPLIEPGFNGTPDTTWDYCTANNGAFMGPNLSPCISCLQATEGQVYLSNFLIALQAGCKQAPEDGTLLCLSGSVFATSPVNITDLSANAQGIQSSGGLPPSAIAGIAIGVFLIFILAVALLIVHFRRERSWDEWEQTCYYSKFPPPAAHPEQSVSQAYRRYYTGNAFSEKTRPPQPNSSGEHYDRVEAELAAASQKKRVNPAPRSHVPSSPTIQSHDTSAAGNVCRPRSFRNATPTRTPSPPADTHAHRRPNTPDSFALQAYLDAAEDSARLAARKPLHPTSCAADSRGKRVSALSAPYLPHMPRLRIPKIFASRRGSKGVREMQISPPLMTNDPRFHDIPMTGPTAVSRDPAPPSLVNAGRRDSYVEVPLSGKSTLYGY
ncbi:uncharacterized protein MAM_06382 [Metarhizium album ARSEF 1941]|uniref:LPXTG-domain-containing protein n=1 Tax=Metarhizium album (strain ARSEF 1941) TaxID=1081103 RepID=A0A0B2WS48_METAS|nr:uncharacterized protein MAM_06382 [Metarhizium album ARSEF 1941]KHN95770.1 hypothetical protein MAM_06382 [Metarhizium album ARSEF 1941]